MQCKGELSSHLSFFTLLWEGFECTGSLPEGQRFRVSQLVVYMLVVPLKQLQSILTQSVCVCVCVCGGGGGGGGGEEGRI